MESVAGVVQSWLWFCSMALFSFILYDLGMLGMPRRIMISVASYIQPAWQPLRPLVGIGRTLLFVSALLYCLNLVLTCVASRAPAPAIPAFAAALSGPEEYRSCSPSISPGDRWAGYPAGTSRQPRRGEAYSCGLYNGRMGDILPGMNAGASTSAVPSPIEGSGTAWVLLGAWALSPARPTPIHPRHECRGFSALLVTTTPRM